MAVSFHSWGSRVEVDGRWAALALTLCAALSARRPRAGTASEVIRREIADSVCVRRSSQGTMHSLCAGYSLGATVASLRP